MVAFRWPVEEVSLQSGTLQSGSESREPVGQKRYSRRFAPMCELNCFGRSLTGQMRELPLGRHLGRQFADWDVLEHNAKDEFMQAFGEQELGQAPFRFRPGGGDDEQHGLAAIGGAAQGFLPTLACCQPAQGIDIEKDVIPTVVHQPLLDGNRFEFIGAGMAEENARHRLTRSIEYLSN